MKLKAAISGSVVGIFATSLLIGISQPAFAGCRDFPESITPECVAQNLAEERSRQDAATAQQAQGLRDAEARAREQAEREYIANGSRPCSLFPASITPECAAENLEYEKERQSISEKKQIEALEKAIKAEAEQQRVEYIRNGSRPCTLFPASITPECAAENLEYEEIRKIESAALTAAKEEAAGANFNTKDENGSLLVVAKIPAKVDLLATVVKLLSSKGKVIDTGVIRYQSNGEPYFVFDNFKGKGNYTVQMSLPKKKFSTLKIKVS
jgi:hypothetical protein